MVCVVQEIVKILTWKDAHWGTVAFLKSVGGYGVSFFKCGGKGQIQETHGSFVPGALANYIELYILELEYYVAK